MGAAGMNYSGYSIGPTYVWLSSCSRHGLPAGRQQLRSGGPLPLFAHRSVMLPFAPSLASLQTDVAAGPGRAGGRHQGVSDATYISFICSHRRDVFLPLCVRSIATA